MRHKVDLMAWISAGKIAGIAPGDHKRQVVEAFGVPLGWASTEDPGEIANFMHADIWGHGAWTTYYEGDSLDAISCVVFGLQEAGWHFDMEEIPTSFFNSIEDVESVLTALGIPCLRIPKIYYVRDVEAGTILRCRRRLGIPTILAGDGLRTRILFDSDGKVKIIGNPVGLRRQRVGYAALDVDRTYEYVSENDVPEDQR